MLMVELSLEDGCSSLGEEGGLSLALSGRRFWLSEYRTVSPSLLQSNFIIFTASFTKNQQKAATLDLMELVGLIVL